MSGGLDLFDSLLTGTLNVFQIKFQEFVHVYITFVFQFLIPKFEKYLNKIISHETCSISKKTSLCKLVELVSISCFLVN